MFKKALAITLVFALATPVVSFAQEREESLVMSAGDSFRKNWNVTFFSIASTENMRTSKNAKAANIDNAAATSYNYFGANYKIDADRKASIRIPFILQADGINKYGDKQKQDIMLSDIHIAYSMYDLGYIGPVDISGNAKAYFPTSDFSQKSGQIAKVRLEGYFEYAIGRFSSITYAVKPDIYWQSRTTSINEAMPIGWDGYYVSDPRSTTKQFSLEHYVEVVADINKYFSIKPALGFDEDWYHTSNIEEIDGGHATQFKARLGVEIRPVRGITFTVGVQNQTNVSRGGGTDGNTIAFWQPENTQYSVMTNALVF